RVQPSDFPERLRGADPKYFTRRKLAKTPAGLSLFEPEALAEYIRCIKNPATIHAMCEDYRATVGIDLETDTADVAAGRTVECPGLLLLGASGGGGPQHTAAPGRARPPPPHPPAPPPPPPPLPPAPRPA